MTITRLATHNVNRLYWLQKMAEFAQANPANDAGLLDVFYDGQMSCYRAADYLADSATWYPRAEYAAKPYRDYWVIGQNAGQGYRYFPEGLVEGILRGQNVSLNTAGMNKLLTTGYAITNGTTGNPYGEYYLQGEQGTRETAYALMTHLEARRPGTGLTANDARIAVLYGYAMAHIDMWIAGTYTFIRPFMVALTCKALIQYYEQYSADAAIRTKLTTLWGTIYTTLWGAVDGFGALSFKYTNINTNTLSTTYTNAGGTISNPAYNSGGIEATPELNLLIVPVFGWLYSVTQDAAWKIKGDLIFDEGISVYNAPTYTVQVRGAFFGTASNPYGKEINQSFWWSDKYLTYTAEVAIVTPTVTTPPLQPSAKSKLMPVFTAKQAGALVNAFGSDSSGSVAWNPANIADGAITSTTVTVIGARLGQTVQVGFTTSVPAGAILQGAVLASNIVVVTLFNKTGGALDLASGTLTARTKATS